MSIVKRRQLFFKIHRYIGLFALAFLVIASVTGCMLCFEKTLDRWLNPNLHQPAAAARVAPIAAVTSFEHAHPELIATYFPVNLFPDENILLSVAARDSSRPLLYDQVFLDPSNGRVTGVRKDRPGWDRAHLVRGVYELHCSLIAGTIGRYIMGIVALMWLAGNIIGVYITLPFRAPIVRYWRRAWIFRPSHTLRQTLIDMHRVCGLWLLVPLTALAFTSLAMSFYTEAVVPAVDALSPTRPSPFDRPPIVGEQPNFMPLAELLARAEKIAAAKHLDWQASTIQRDLEHNLSGVRFTRTGYEEYRALGPVTLWFDASGRLAYEDNPYEDSVGMAFERSLFPLHTGQIIGTFGIALELLLGAATLLLSLSGVYLWLKRHARHTWPSTSRPIGFGAKK